MLNLDAITNENNKDHNKSGYTFQIIHIGC